MRLRTLKKRLVTWLGPWLAYWAIKVLGLTMRFEAVNLDIPRSILENGQVAIGAFWHGRLLMMPFAYKHKGLKVSFLVSPHRDGQVVGKALQRFGFRPILGSTTRKGFTAFKNMLRALQDGSIVMLVPDGPRGPRCRVQIGVVELARLTGRPVIPITFSSSRKKTFNSWDRFLLPYPFSKAFLGIMRSQLHAGLLAGLNNAEGARDGNEDLALGQLLGGIHRASAVKRNLLLVHILEVALG
jgi:lysophospholipid acyltransferase (LPLAT)-like uncharacterized protein